MRYFLYILLTMEHISCIIFIQVEVIVIKEIVKKNLSEEVYERIKQDIRCGNLSEGSKVPSENSLATSLSVSRVVVREALKKLRDEHVIVTYQGSGSYVANPKNFLDQTQIFDISFDEFCEIMEFRSCIEFAAIKLCVQNATDEELVSLRTHLQGMKTNIDDPIMFTKSDYEFHLSIVKASHNSIFLEVMESKREEILKCLGSMNKINSSHAFAIELHEKIAKKIENRDSKGAIDLLKNNGEYNKARFNEIFN